MYLQKKYIYISSGSVNNIQTDFFSLHNLSARCGPRALTVDQKMKSVVKSRTLLSRFQFKPDNFHRRIVTWLFMSWVHHFEPELTLSIYFHLTK